MAVDDIVQFLQELLVRFRVSHGFDIGNRRVEIIGTHIAPVVQQVRHLGKQ